jgi:hypothetical protein
LEGDKEERERLGGGWALGRLGLDGLSFFLFSFFYFDFQKRIRKRERDSISRKLLLD